MEARYNYDGLLSKVLLTAVMRSRSFDFSSVSQAQYIALCFDVLESAGDSLTSRSERSTVRSTILSPHASLVLPRSLLVVEEEKRMVQTNGLPGSSNSHVEEPNRAPNAVDLLISLLIALLCALTRGAVTVGSLALVYGTQLFAYLNNVLVRAIPQLTEALSRAAAPAEAQPVIVHVAPIATPALAPPPAPPDPELIAVDDPIPEPTIPAIPAIPPDAAILPFLPASMPLYAGPPGSPRPLPPPAIALPGEGTRFICVLRGRRVGVFLNWDAASPHVLHVAGNSHKGYATYEEACDVFDASWTAGKVAPLY
ncbi:hypothetical protein SISSUDRAFT_1061470 [Sistotremastrum suecicum HHB10207 ss-3]|uniref:Ribonuclease H1 N-terminal domain-containing protein n=1 Tax=Sistotremastrum suecicum HHB10207 ss-3 TaxID=1314776 RepID=A0A166E004_9AGAM|nr:hypothetical protein SISSUDRAFT_1061470 [Sistotremastrum suecicum HHB10207 ss-3]